MGDEDKEAQELMANMGMGDVPSDDESEEMDPEAMLEKFRREVDISPDNHLDQLIVGCSDLEKAVDKFEAMTGVRPMWVVSVNGTGTKSARVAFETAQFIEILGPDPKQSETPFSAALAKLPEGELVPVHYAVRMQKAAELDVRMGWKKQGLDYDQLTMVCKDKGMPWMWDMYFIKGQDGCMPFITDWTSHDSMHASAKIPVVGTLTSVKVSAPSDHIVHKILESPTGMDLSTGSASLEFTFSSPKGSHTLSSSDPIGISFPDEGGIAVGGN